MIDVALFKKMVDNVGGLHARLHMLPVHLELVLHLEGWPTILPVSYTHLTLPTKA